jgi:hypothetical protein
MKTLNSQQERTLATITERLYIIMIENPLVNANEAIELAFKQEQDFLSEMIDQKTERSKKGLQQINKNVYGLIQLIK